MKTASEITSSLAHCNCTEQWHRHFTGLLFTDGVYQLAEMADCYWLIDVIASHQTRRVREATDGFQLWTITVDLAEHTGVVTCQGDSGEPFAVVQEIPFTDFPLASLKLYVEGSGRETVLLLPSEH